MIFRTCIGLDISPSGLRGVALRRQGRKVHLLGAGNLSWAGVVSPSVREPNVVDPQRFVTLIRKVLEPLAGREERVALSVQDGAGRVILTETAAPFRSKKEGVDTLKWQLKNSLPVDAREMRLDYQVLEKGEAGRTRVVAAVMAAKVLEQYERLLEEAGFGAAVVDFHSLNLYNYYRPRLDLGEDFVLVGMEGSSFSLQLFQGRVLRYHRAREISPDPEKVFQETIRSLAGSGDRQTGPGPAVFLHTDWQDAEGLREALRSAFEREVVLLHPHLERLGGTGDGAVAAGMAAAIGAAERMIR